ncbi:MAG: hypothetical protein ABI140_04355 [Jatrophihabitantaceae bacterium]
MSRLDDADSDQPGWVSEANREWFGGRLWTGVAAIAVLLILAAAVIIAKIGHGGSSQTSAAPAASSASTTPAGPGRSAVSAGSPVPLDQQPLTSAPSPIQWQLVDQVALPYSATAGPDRVSGGVASGFAHGATGALLALLQTWPRSGWINPGDQRAEITAMSTGAGVAAELASAPVTQLAIRPQIVGFRYLSYGPDRAVIDMAVRFTNADDGSTLIRSFEASEVWQGGDWRYESLPLDQLPEAPILSDLSGYVAFSGV